MAMQNGLKKTAADFFAGIGLVQIGLENQGWEVVYSVDNSDEKHTMYKAHFGEDTYHKQDIFKVEATDVPNIALAHASFPCTDISIAGSRVGINGTQSSTFWGFIKIIEGLEDRKPPIVLIENVENLISTNAGKDLNIALKALCDLGYVVDILVVDAVHFVPQSRKRLFIIGTLGLTKQSSKEVLRILEQSEYIRPSKASAFIKSHKKLCWRLRQLPPFPNRSETLRGIIDPKAEWWPEKRKTYLFNQMSEKHQEKVRKMMKSRKWLYGTAFRRMRGEDGNRRSMAEIRTDGIAGCLRTPKGGSARQILIRAGRGKYDARLLNERECAKLMGAGNYKIDSNLSLNQVLFGFGDAVCVPVVEWVAENYLNPVFEELSVSQKMPN